MPDAPVRFDLVLDRAPTHRSAGYFVNLPDGGIAPGRVPSPIAYTRGGEELPTYLLIYNREGKMAVVFGAPEDGSNRVYLYLRSDNSPKWWTPESELTPSGILIGDPDRATMAAAQKLAEWGEVGPRVDVVNKPGVPIAPLSIGGHESGRPRPGSFYLLAHVEVIVDPGEYWLAPFTLDGETEVLVNGQRLNPRKRDDRWGGTGVSMELPMGIHRVEVFQTAPGEGPLTSAARGGRRRDGGLMFLAWRAPHENLHPEVAARVFKEEEIVRSGQCRIVGVQSQDGSPVASIVVRRAMPFWVGEEKPMLAYHFEALGAEAQGEEVTFTWTFDGDLEVEGPSVWWLLPGFEEHRVRLVASSAKGRSTAVFPFYTFTQSVASFDNPDHRAAFRNACTNMLRAAPSGDRSLQGWSDGQWNNLIRTLELGEGHELLTELFTNHWNVVRDRLSEDQIEVFQDAFLIMEAKENPESALRWVRQFATGATNISRRNELRVREAEIQAMHFGEFDTARQLLTAIVNMETPEGERARIRMGDIAFMEGDLNEATGRYLRVQNRVRRDQGLGTGSGRGLVAEELLSRPEERSGRAQSRPTPPPLRSDRVAAWRAGAIQDVSFSENIQTLIEGGYLLEASEALKAWEFAFPMSKLSDDYFLRQAAFLMAVEDWTKAQNILMAYCRNVDASSFLPQAATMLVECSEQAGEPDPDVREVIEKLRDKLKFHPVSRELDEFLERSEQGTDSSPEEDAATPASS